MQKKKFEEVEAHQLDAFRISAIAGDASNRLREIKTVAGVEHYLVTPELLRVMAEEFRKLADAPAAPKSKSKAVK
jgi:hypothetical protein